MSESDLLAVSPVLDAEQPHKRRRRRARQAGLPKGGAGSAGSRSQRSGLKPVIVLLALTLSGSLLAVGTVHVLALLVVAPFALATGIWAIRKDGRSLKAIPAAAWVAFSLAGYSLLQALPLPSSIVRLLSAASATVWTRGLLPLGSSTAWLSLSLDPGASTIEALKWFCYGSVFTAGAVISAEQSRRVVPTLVFGCSLLAALVALAHRLADADSLYGIYTPSTHAGIPIAPLINPNNFAGYLNLGAFAGLGSLLVRKPILPRWAVGVGVSVVVGLSAACHSRAGLASLALGMLALLFALSFMKFEDRQVRGLRWVALAVLLGGIALFLLGANDHLLRSMVEEGAKKFALISWTKPVIADYPLFGIGRGAFETVFPSYRADAGHHLYQFAENFVMQWCVEWGIPVAAAACLAFGYFFSPKRLGVQADVLSLCCAIGAAVLLLQNLLDLALEVPSVSLALFALLGSLSSRPKDPVRETHNLRAIGVLVAVAGAAWSVAALVGIHSAFDDRQAIAELSLAAGKGDLSARSALKPALWSAIARHPADPYFPLVAALLTRGKKNEELSWVARAIERDPMAGRPYLILAEALARRNARSQSLATIRLAVEREYDLVGPGATLALSMTRDFDELMGTVPDGAAGVGMLVHLARQNQLQAFRERLLRDAMSRDVEATSPRLVRAEDLLAALEGNAEVCAGARRAACVAEARELGRALAQIAPKSDTPTLIAARLMLVEGDAAGAQRLLAATCGKFALQTDCVKLRFQAAERTNDKLVLEEAAATLLGDACSAPTACAWTATWLGNRYAGRGDWALALRMYERAAHESDSPGDWRVVAEMANRLGLSTVASRASKRAGGPVAAELTHTLERKRITDLIDLEADAGSR